MLLKDVVNYWKVLNFWKVEEWKNISAKEIAKNKQPIASGSGLPFTEQIAPSTLATQSMRSPLIGEPQVDLSSLEGLEMEWTLRVGPK